MQLRTKIGLRLVGQEFWAFFARREDAIRELEAELEQKELEQIRVARDLIERFHEALESEIDEDTLQEGLKIALVDLNDHVARLEEHHVG